MKVGHNKLLWDERQNYIEKTERPLKEEIYDPLPEYVGIVRRRNKQNYRNTLFGGITVSIICALGLGGLRLLTPLQATLSGGFIFGVVFVLALDHKTVVEQDIENGDIDAYLTSKELRELDDLRLSLKPTTKLTQRALKQINEIWDKHLEI